MHDETHDERMERAKNGTTGSTPAPVWPPAPRRRPPDAAPRPPRRTLTPFALLDAVIGLPAGCVTGYLIVLAAYVLLPGRHQVVTACAAALVLLCAVCYAAGRRFPVLVTMVAVGTLAVASVALYVAWAVMNMPQ